ncbi:hypothetical protein L596_005839 [Steinernema carpocapsae]|uniref:Uncharacterized protein n=1 Tax=Steinernema carpocapsae TaxID=34508 RepID=A0A4U8V0E3_STECR|nr:hypothetical protein L596_005839 [Steinernema carpocapsae]
MRVVHKHCLTFRKSHILGCNRKSYKIYVDIEEQLNSTSRKSEFKKKQVLLHSKANVGFPLDQKYLQATRFLFLRSKRC